MKNEQIRLQGKQKEKVRMTKWEKIDEIMEIRANDNEGRKSEN